jgi:hypothetical protein
MACQPASTSLCTACFASGSSASRRPLSIRPGWRPMTARRRATTNADYSSARARFRPFAAFFVFSRERYASSSRPNAELRRAGPRPVIAPRETLALCRRPSNGDEVVVRRVSGSNAGVAADCPLRRVCERADGHSLRVPSFSPWLARAIRRVGASFARIPFPPQNRRAAPGLRRPILAARRRLRAPNESYTCPTR